MLSITQKCEVLEKKVVHTDDQTSLSLERDMNKWSFAISGLALGCIPFLGADEFPSSTQGKEASGFVNPPSRFQVENGWNLFLNTEFLWWVAKEDGLYYAQGGFSGESTSAVPPNGTIDFKGHLKKITPDWFPGFRIGFGGNMGYDEWDLFLNWTWFKSHGRNSSEGLLLVLWAHPDADGASAATDAKGVWDLHINLLDLELGRAFWVGKHFSLHPFFGARGAWIDQDLKLEYTLTTAPVTEYQYKPKCNFEGGGIRAGLDARFAMLGGWSLYGLASGSLLYGHFDTDAKGKWNGTEIGEVRDGFHQAASTVQLALGVRWDTYLHKDRYHVGLYAGWEQNIWFGLNKMNHYFGNLNEGNLEQFSSDLTLQGGTFGVRFDF